VCFENLVRAHRPTDLRRRGCRLRGGGGFIFSLTLVGLEGGGRVWVPLNVCGAGRALSGRRVCGMGPARSPTTVLGPIFWGVRGVSPRWGMVTMPCPTTTRTRVSLPARAIQLAEAQNACCYSGTVHHHCTRDCQGRTHAYATRSGLC
jgi:hypothetical protein